MARSKTLFAFYGDDFTGSTDALDALSRRGVPTVLFLKSPTKKEFSEYRFRSVFAGNARVEAFGIAGMSRTMSPRRMKNHLPETFKAMGALKPDYLHYKVCSTFDSSPTIGSIGKAIEIGSAVFGNSCVPLVVGSSELKRYVVFGHLFADYAGKVYAIDRHPVMSVHPVTPMTDSSLLVHLAKQTRMHSRNVTIPQLEALEAGNGLRRQYRDNGIVLFDTLTAEHLKKIARIIRAVKARGTQFLTGSSGVELAMSMLWQEEGRVTKDPAFPSIVPRERVLVVSGSCSPTSERQITHALKHGFAGIRLDAMKVLDRGTRNAEIARVQKALHTAMDKGRSVLIYSATGPDDPMLKKVKARGAKSHGKTARPGDLIASTQAALCKWAVEEFGLKRVLISGGDTSGHVTSALNITALEMLAPVSPGAPLCIASSETTTFDGLELFLKGGQMGTEDVFLRLRDGFWGRTSVSG